MLLCGDLRERKMCFNICKSCGCFSSTFLFPFNRVNKGATIALYDAGRAHFEVDLTEWGMLAEKNKCQLSD